MSKEGRVVKVKKYQKVFCPTKEHENWDLHPRVSIDMKDKKSNTCPYCGTVFRVEK